MKQANIDFLERNRDCYTEVLNAETAIKANRIVEDLLRIVREEFYPDYPYKGDCGDCLFTLVRTLYTEFDKKQAKELPRVIQTEPLVVATGFPKDEPPEIEVKGLNQQQDYHDEFVAGLKKVGNALTIAARAEKRKADSLKRHRK